VGDGSCAKFLHDIWWGYHPLKKFFPELFCLARNRDAIVVDLKIVSNDMVHWDINLIRLVHDWEVDSVSSFFNVLYSAGVGREADDGLCWTPSKRSFEVKSFYKVLLPNVDSSFSWKSIWRTKAPLRLPFFTMIASLGKILTLDLQKRHIIAIE
jgi:hypothetical protein